MDIDMHYYGTYALARAAGLGIAAAVTAATAAEFVDDASGTAAVQHPSGARFQHETTAHHPTDLLPNNDRDDQLKVWVPFHFLPGDEGADLSERLICRKDSAVAQAMVAHHLDLADSDLGLVLIGITAHVYADTFAHYGFSGVSSQRNRVAAASLEALDVDPLVTRTFGEGLARFMAKYGRQGGLLDNFRHIMVGMVSAAAEDLTGALGHGAVATFPDLPYLRWRYRYEAEALWPGRESVERDNRADYLQAARALHGMFAAFAARRPELRDPAGGRPFDAIEPVVRRLLATVGEREERIAGWKREVAAGHLTGQPGETVPDYGATAWRDAFAALATLTVPEDALAEPVHHFQRAAARHRHYVLREALPARRIVLV